MFAVALLQHFTRGAGKREFRWVKNQRWIKAGA